VRLRAPAEGLLAGLLLAMSVPVMAQDAAAQGVMPAAVPDTTPGPDQAAAPDTIPGPSPRRAAKAGAFQAVLNVKELGMNAGFRLRVYHDPGFIRTPESAGTLFLVCADSAFGEGAFFIPTDIAFEVGPDLVYRVEFEQASDLFGQALGGRVRAGEQHLGFILVPPEAEIEKYLPGSPEQIVMRYANRRARLEPAGEADQAWWNTAVQRPLLAAGLNTYWEWARVIDTAPEMSEGDRRFFAERIFPGQGEILGEEDISAEALRNAILRVGENRLLASRITQRVDPEYPVAARQMNAQGLVVILAYITGDGTVGDALILASNTVHMLNLAALAAAQDWRFARVKDHAGNYVDGWRLIPIQFRLKQAVEIPTNDFVPAQGYQGPRIVKPVDPGYPLEALNRNLKGTVKYRVKLDADGRLVEAILEQSVHPILDAAALAAVEKTRFLPATQDGKPVPSEIEMTFPFAPKK
jgi:TonB family protein